MTLKISLKLALFTTALVIGTAAFATEKAADKQREAEMMKKFMEASTPGAAHKVLTDLAGDYNFSSKSWPDPNAKPMEGKGVATMTPILGGRWLEYKVVQAPAAENPGFEGFGLLGYDNVKKEYRSIWLDTHSTGPMIGGGKFNAVKKTLNDNGVYSCPLTGKDRDYRSEWLMKDKNTVMFSLFGTSPFTNDTKEMKMMEITFKRK